MRLSWTCAEQSTREPRGIKHDTEIAKAVAYQGIREGIYKRGLLPIQGYIESVTTY